MRLALASACASSGCIAALLRFALGVVCDNAPLKNADTSPAAVTPTSASTAASCSATRKYESPAPDAEVTSSVRSANFARKLKRKQRTRARQPAAKVTGDAFEA